MKKLIVLIAMLFMVQLYGIALPESDDSDKKPITILPGNEGGVPIFRSPIVVPFECYYLVKSGSILIKNTSDVSIFNVEVLNLTTGDVFSKEVYSAYGTNIISLMIVPGFYQLNLVSSSGELFTGYFEVD